NDLPGGTYTVSVTDDAGCQGSIDISINEPEVIELTIFKTDISCFGQSDGSASATVTGGTGEYFYDWSNGEHGISTSGLAQGSHSLEVNDEQGCNTAKSFTIIEPSEINLSTSVSSGESCSGFDGSGLVNVMGGTGTYTYSWNNGMLTQSLDGVSAGTYSVIVWDANQCAAEAQIEIPYDCEIESPTTSLTSIDCQATGLHLDEYVNCVPVTDAEMYQWKFENAAEGIFAEEFTLGNNPSFQLGLIPNIEYGIELEISIKVLHNNIWSPYGTVCAITTAEEIPLTQLVNGDCGAENMALGSSIQVEAIDGATEYEWFFTSLEFQEIYVSYMNSLMLTEEMGLVPGESYHISVRSKVGETWSDYGATCTVGLSTSTGIAGLDDALDVSIYPNPSSGDKIFIEFGNFYESNHVSEFEVFNATGKLIESFTLSDEMLSPTGTEHFFENTLSTGMYILRFTVNGNALEEKLIVR
ncbi:MAG: T9SS type A sorting domain-containing protein, partial [Flavobacteriales bacterium]|nr:T9SS type A sorting domain-containing protein [Flavobacteriales bacterium]